MPRLLALLDDPSFGSEPVVFSCNAALLQRRAGGGVHDAGYLFEAAGATFSARYDRSALEGDAAFKGKRGKKGNQDSDSDVGESYGGKDKKGSSSPNKGGGFLKLSDYIKGLDLYALLGCSEGSSQEEIRKAYRALALTAHPDKQAADLSEEEMKGIQEKFVQIQEAYEILSEPSKRQMYDSSLDFDDSLPKFKSGMDFYEVFGECFKRNARFSVKRPVPEIGGADSKPEEWKKFYNFWCEFQSWRDPVMMAEKAGEDICDLNDSECREERRWMIRENDRVAKKYKRAEGERISELVNMAEKYDPRIQAEKDAKKAAREAEGKAKAEAKQAVQRAREEEERKKKEEEEKIRAAAEQKRLEEKAVKDAAKNKLKQCRQRVRALHPSVSKTVSLDQLNEVCLRLEEPDLVRLAEAGEKALHCEKKKPLTPKKIEQCAKVLHEAIASIGLEPVTKVAEDDDDRSTSSGGPSIEAEDPEVLRQRQIAMENSRIKQEKEEAIKAEERAIRDAEQAELKKKRDEQRRKDQAAQDAAKRQQEKKEGEKKKKEEERKKKAEDQEKQQKDQQRDEAKIRAQEQAAADKQRAAEAKEEQEMERIVQMLITDRVDRLTKLDALTDEALTAALTQAKQEDAALGGAWALLKESAAEVFGLREAEEVLDRGMALVHKVDPVWVLGLLLDAEIQLPNAVRNRAKKARQRLQKVVQALLAQVVPKGADTQIATEWQRGIIDGSIAVPVFNVEMKEAEEEAAKVAATAASQGKEDEQVGKAKKKKAGKAKGGEDDDLDKLLAAIEDPTVSPKKTGKKKK